MKILSAQQTREVDAHTIEHEPIASIDLMERASIAFVNWFVPRYDQSKSILVVVGSGNNGGDALAIARVLHNKSYVVSLYLAGSNTKGSVDYNINLERLPSKIEILDKFDGRSDVIIDGLFGSGLSREIEGKLVELIQIINELDKPIISIDIASGLGCEDIAKGENIIKPTHTVSFQLPKLAFLLSENEQFVGYWHMVDIGLGQDYISKLPVIFNYQLHNEIKECLLKRPKFGHKGIFGKVLIVGGSYGKMGAMVLASKASLRSGTGLVTSLIPACGYQILQTAVPEAMCITSGDAFLRNAKIENLLNYDAIGIGPGLGTSLETLPLLLEILKKYNKPMVLDADALNLISENPELIELIPAGSILTPHIGEFHRLLGDSPNSLERLANQRDFSRKHHLILVLKGAYSSISDVSGNIWFNSTGNAGMATAGSGDVLTGIITGLLAQGYSSINAAKLGVYLHGCAGDIAKDTLGEQALIAGDLIERISEAFISLE